MRPDAFKDIIYPGDFIPSVDSDAGLLCEKPYHTVPHKALTLCRDELDMTFSGLRGKRPSHIFVLCPLHKGKVFEDDTFRIYSYSDCFVSHPLIERNDDICSEEYSYEMLLPYLDAFFKDIPSTAFYAPCADPALRDFVLYLKENHEDPLFLVSDNLNCSRMWKEAF